MATTFRKTIFTLIILAVLIFLAFLYAARHPATENSPMEFKNSLWVCEDPYIEISVESMCDVVCRMRSEDGMAEAVVGFGYGGDLELWSSEEGYMQADRADLAGDCDFSESRMVVHITTDEIFNGRYDDLVFERVR